MFKRYIYLKKKETTDPTFFGLKVYSKNMETIERKISSRREKLDFHRKKWNHIIWMIKVKQVFFWTSNLKGHDFYGDKATIFLFDFIILFIVCAVWKTLFSWNRFSKSNVIAI